MTETIDRSLVQALARGLPGPAGPSLTPVWNGFALSFEDGTGNPVGPAAKNLLGPEGPAGAAQTFPTRPAAIASVINPLLVLIRIMSFDTGYPFDPAFYVPGTSGGPMAFQDAGSNWWQLDLSGPRVAATWFGVKADGINVDDPATQLAINAAAGREVYLPKGTIVWTSQVHWITTGAGTGTFNPGLRLRGAGDMLTFIDNRVANNSCLYIGQNDGLGFQKGGWVRDLSIITTTNPTASHGIEHRACYQYLVENVWVDGLSGDGMRVTAIVGDNDASNIMNYRNCRFEYCDIGLNSNFNSGVVQPSFMKVEDCLFSGNRIGWRYIGLDALSINNGFVIQTECGLQIVNNGGSNAQFTSLNTSFENNLLSININSLQGATFIQTELACGSLYAAQAQAVILDNCQGVEFTGTRVRINNTQHTLWLFEAGACSNTIKNTFYQNYDNAGQTRYNENSACYGNRLDDTFGSIVIGARNGVLGISCATGANPDLALPIDGEMYALGGSPGPTGAFSISGLTNGFSGRQLILKNPTGQTLTILAENTGSIAANRIRTEGNADVTLANQGCARFVYDGGDSRWHYLGKG